MRASVWTALAAAVLVVAGCDRGGSPLQVVSGGTGIVLSVGAGTTPAYSWTGPRARSFFVQSSSGEVFWQLEALNPLEGFDSPLQHGVTPVGARVVISARPLMPGVVHTARVVGIDGTQGFRSFIPTPLTSP